MNITETASVCIAPSEIDTGHVFAINIFEASNWKMIFSFPRNTIERDTTCQKKCTTSVCSAGSRWMYSQVLMKMTERMSKVWLVQCLPQWAAGTWWIVYSLGGFVGGIVSMLHHYYLQYIPLLDAYIRASIWLCSTLHPLRHNSAAPYFSAVVSPHLNDSPRLVPPLHFHRTAVDPPSLCVRVPKWLHRAPGQ